MARIFVVDDDMDVLDSVKMILESKGHEVSVSNNIVDAEKGIKSSGFDLILLDIMMESPDDGITFARKLKKDGITAPVVMMSGVGKVTGYEYGKCDEVLPCVDFIEKPVKPQGLIQKVESILNGKA